MIVRNYENKRIWAYVSFMRLYGLSYTFALSEDLVLPGTENMGVSKFFWYILAYALS